ncbi:MAG TPA: oligopeptidase B, partial [candidate division Zixibacteria bacterium]|nr:oligopeptidase B [candidate division Zixibacteria bacterium]
MKLSHSLALILIAVALVASAALAQETAVAPHAPVAAMIPRVDTVNGNIVRIDDYYWLRNRGDSAVMAYLEAENAYTEACMAHTAQLQEDLYKEMRARIKETDMSVPARYMDYYYYARTEEGRQYNIYCRKKGSLEAPEEIILDVNRLAENFDYYQVGAFEISPDQQLLAYTFDTAGSEVYTLVVKNMLTGDYFSDTLPNVSAVAWAGDNLTLFYTVEDETRRPYQLFRHKLGAAPAEDRLVYHEQDPAFYVGVGETRSRRYLMMMIGSQITSEVWYLRTDNPESDFTLFAPREQGVEYSVDHQGDNFYITTNKDAVNFRLLRTPTADPSPANWTEVIPARDSVKLDGVDCFKDYLVVYEHDRGLPMVQIRTVSDGAVHYIAFDQPIYSVYPNRNPSYDASKLRLNFQSLITPSTIFDYDMDSRKRTTLKQEEVLGGYNPEDYAQERVWATAPDGTRIPISMCYRKGMVRDGSHPLYLYGYGA